MVIGSTSLSHSLSDAVSLSVAESKRVDVAGHVTQLGTITFVMYTVVQKNFTIFHFTVVSVNIDQFL